MVDEAILAIAKRQRGAFGRQQAFAAGASERFIGRRLGAGDWVKLDTSVYGLPGWPGTWERQLMIALLGTHDAAVGGRSAAVVHSFPGFRPGRPEIVVPLTVTCRSKVAITHRYAGAKLTKVDGWRVTTVAQTLSDLASLTSPWALERAMDDQLLTKRLSVDDLDERIRFYAGARRKGGPLFRALTSERRDGAWQPPESELEALAMPLLERVPGLQLERQVRLKWREGGTARVDLLDRRNRLVIELDGRRWHARLADFDRDRWRDNEVVAHGLRPLRFTWVHLVHAPDAVVDLVKRTLEVPAELTHALVLDPEVLD